MRNQVLSRECEKRGFIRIGKSYMRVIGDGVFQNIVPDAKERLDPSSPRYSQKHRYEPRILIYLKSLYVRYDGLFVSIDQDIGFSLTVPQLLDKQDTPFLSATAEMERMINEGLDVLDTITSQNQIIANLEPLTFDRREMQQRYSTQLYDIYLFQEEFYKARMSIEGEFAQGYFSNMSNCRVNPEAFSEKMQCFLDRVESYYERYMLTWPAQYDAAKDRLQKNFEVNSRRLQEIGIHLR